MYENAIDMRTVTMVIVIGLMFWFVLSQFRFMRNENQRSRKIESVLSGITIAISLIFLTESISLALARSLPINNLGWYLGYATGAIGCYQFGRIACDTDMHPHGDKLRQVLVIGLWLLLFTQSFLYVFEIASTPEWTERTPRSLIEYIFSSIYFIYCSAIALLAIITTRMAIFREENPAQRLRLSITWAGAMAALGCFVGKLVYLWCFYFYRDLIGINQFALISMVISGSLLPLAVMPGWFFRWLTLHNPFVYIRQVWRLYWLNRLSKRVYTLLPGLARSPYSWLHQLIRIRLSIYRVTIALLDGQKMLNDCLQMEERRRASAIGLSWSESEKLLAQSLNITLQKLLQFKDEKQAGYEEVADVLVELVGRLGSSISMA